MSQTLRLTWLLLRKDLTIAARSKEVLGVMLLFALLCVVVFAFGFLREGTTAADQVPGVLWVTLLFSGTVGLLRLFHAEEEGGTWPLVARTRAGTLPLFLSKCLLQLGFSGVVTVVLAPLTVVFFDAEVPRPGVVAGALLLGLIGQSVLGALCAALLQQVRMKEALLPLILYPLLAPLLLGGVQITARAMTPGADVPQDWLALLLAFDLLAVVLSPWLFARAGRLG
jgi:heme exporter protein B